LLDEAVQMLDNCACAESNAGVVITIQHTLAHYTKHLDLCSSKSFLLLPLLNERR
jgi:hypothetical protein